MFAAIKEALGTSVLEGTRRGGGGCISEGEVYRTDTGKVFLKRNSKEKAREMFDGELESLKAIQATGTVRAPTAHLVVNNPAGGAVLVMEYLDMRGLNRKSGQLGADLARLHLYNHAAREAEGGGTVGRAASGYVEQYGFPINTCCGYITQDNTWTSDWQVFYSRKLDSQLSLIQKECVVVLGHTGKFFLAGVILYELPGLCCHRLTTNQPTKQPSNQATKQPSTASLLNLCLIGCRIIA